MRALRPVRRLLLALAFAVAAAPAAAVLAPAPARAAKPEPTRRAAPKAKPPKKAPPRVTPQIGKASYYARRFHGRRTASGERYDERAMTCAHPTLPFGTTVRVEHLGNGKSVVLRVNDRGPHTGRRIVDVSRAAAQALDLIQAGEARVKLVVIDR